MIGRFAAGGMYGPPNRVGCLDGRGQKLFSSLNWHGWEGQVVSKMQYSVSVTDDVVIG